jgi:hypothetical protein
LSQDQKDEETALQKDLCGGWRVRESGTGTASARALKPNKLCLSKEACSISQLTLPLTFSPANNSPCPVPLLSLTSFYKLKLIWISISLGLFKYLNIQLQGEL